MSHQIELDPQQIKAQLKEFLKGKSQLKDYDYEGSNISALLDVLAYNSYLNNLYVNMAINEMFLDTAQTEDAVRSHAKELNYLPRSRRSAKATVNVAIEVPSTVFSVVIPKGTSFTSATNNNAYNFVADQNYTALSNGSVASATIDIYEGSYKSEFFVVNTSETNQQFVIQDNRIDTSSMVVKVTESASDSSNSNYVLAPDLYGLTSESLVYFLQPHNDGKYQILFGNGVTGKAVQNGNIIEVNYRISSGDGPNGVSIFSSGSISGYPNTSAVVANTESYARGGALAETIESIKFNSVRHYQTLRRAVTSEDYKNLILQNYPEIEAINVYGGETVIPPKFGRVIISADVKNADGMSKYLKDDIKEYIDSRSPVTIESEFIDPDFLDIEVDTTVKYNINLTTQSIEDIKNKVRTKILQFSSDNLVDFNKTLVYSKLISAIDNTDTSIVGNSTTLRAIRTLSVVANQSQNFDIKYSNPLVPDYSSPTTTNFTNYKPAIRSAGFTKDLKTCFIEDDANGNLQIVNFDNNKRNIIQNFVGTVDYTNGIVAIVGLELQGYTGSGLKLYGRISTLDISAKENLIIQIKNQDINVNVTQERI